MLIHGCFPAPVDQYLLLHKRFEVLYTNTNGFWKELIPMIVSLPEMLDARERRALRQQVLLRDYGSPLISFTMNIAGPIKDTPLIRRGFQIGLRDL